MTDGLNITDGSAVGMAVGNIDASCSEIPIYHNFFGTLNNLLMWHTVLMNFRRPSVWRRLCHFSSGCLRVRLFVAHRFASLFVDVAERAVTFARFSKGRVVGAVSKISVAVPSLKKKERKGSPLTSAPATFVTEMGKKKACQDVRVPRPLDAEETRLYGWVEGAVLTQPSLVGSDLSPEFCRNYALMEDSGAEGDYVLEAAGPSERVPFRAGEDRPHFH
ncbi:hypothetical protein PIB30_023690 [Stylosanthes scabra]|uniref:Uncharacterized protein n=1 Tax=Stylosanthes scabra TaxID=79078 RepID=A0ABU6T9C1_9FABA|nr:hypothetical protein [Stylosanthes scabra]